MPDTKESNFRERAGELEPLPGLLDFIAKGREKGTGIALVTNAPKENVPAILRALGLEGAFETVILGEELDAGKPDPAPYSAALEALSVSAGEAVAFEDSPSALPRRWPPVYPRSASPRPKSPRISRSSG